MTLTEHQIRQTNKSYRSEEPSELHKETFMQALRGENITDDQRTELINRLYRKFSASKKELGKEPASNGLMKNVQRKEYSIQLNISEKLFHQQPIGVLLRPINDEVRKRGEAIITSIDPYSEDVEPNVMPHYHYKITITPMPLFIEMWMGENGYPYI